jgi:hypothetical protein
VELTRAASLFDRLANGIATMPHARADGSSADATVRERLDGLFPKFRALYGGLLVKHIGPDQVNDVLRALDNRAVRSYLVALEKMEPELIAGLQDLTREMIASVFQSG